jgi:hypothetical protein
MSSWTKTANLFARSPLRVSAWLPALGHRDFPQRLQPFFPATSAARNVLKTALDIRKYFLHSNLIIVD